MSAAFAAYHHNSVAEAFAAAGHSVDVRINRNGDRRVSVNGAPETDVRAALARMEKIMTRERSWPWQRT